MPLPPFQQFVDEHGAAVYRFLRGTTTAYEVDDCFQETFLAALRAYPRARPEPSLRSWVLKIAHRKAIDAHRARSRRAVPVGGPDEPALDVAVQDGPAALDGALWAQVRELPPKQRSAIVLRYVDDLPHREIASVLGCSEDAARRNLHEGLRKLREAVPR